MNGEVTVKKIQLWKMFGRERATLACFQVDISKGTNIWDPKLRPHIYCTTKSEKQLKGQNGRIPVSVCERSPELQHSESHKHKGLCIGWSHDPFPGYSHSWLLVILLVSA